MSDTDLHNRLSGLSEIAPELALNERKLRAQLLQHASQQTSLEPPSAFLYQLLRGNSMKEKLAHMNIVLAVTGTLLAAGTASAATYYWFQTQTTMHENHGVVQVDVDNCSTLPSPFRSAQERFSFTEKYRILDESYMTKQDVEHAVLADCEQRTIASLIRQAFPDMDEFARFSSNESKVAPNEIKANSRGLFFPIYQNGIVRSVSGDQITIEDITAQDPQLSQSATLQVAPDVLVLDAGQTIKLSDLKPGDRIHFAYQNRQIPGQTFDRHSIDSMRQLTDLGNTSVIRGISKTSFDYHILDKLRRGVPDKIEPIQMDPARG